MTNEIVSRKSTSSIVSSNKQSLDTNPAAVYLASLSSPSGRRTQKQALDTIAGWFTQGEDANCFTFPWQNLRYQHTAAIRAHLVAAYSPATANKFLSAIRRVLKEAWRLGLMSAEEYQRAADVANTSGETVPAGRELHTEELNALLAVCAADETAAGARDAAVIAILYGAGLRREEVARLDLADYDQQSGKLVIKGKRSKERTTYLTGGAAGALADWITVRGRDPGALFHPVTKFGKIMRRRMTNQAVYNILEKHGKMAGVSKFSPHDMRRTFVSELLDAGVDIATVAKMAGHTNVQTTARYDRRGEQAKQKAAGLINVPYKRKLKEEDDGSPLP